MEELDTRMIPASTMALTTPQQVLEEILTNSMPFVVMNQLVHQESVTANLQQIT